MGDRLAEADPGIEADPVLADAGLDREREPLLEERGHLAGHVVVARIGLHRPRLALHVHEAEVRVGGGGHVDELGVRPERSHVVDHLGPELERAAGDRRLRGVDRDGHLAVEPLEDGDDAA